MRNPCAIGKQETSIVVAHMVYFLILASATYLTRRMAGLELNNIIDIWDISVLPAALAAVAILAVFSGNSQKPSSIFLHLILLTLVTPSLVIFVSGGLPWSFAGMTVAAFLVVAITPTVFSIPGSWNGYLSSAGLMWFCLIAVIAYTVAILILNGYQYINFSIWKVYEMRNLAAESLPRIFGYLTPITTGILISIAAVEATRRKSLGLMFFLVVLGVFLFGLTSHKGIALNAVASIAFYWLAKQKRPVEAIVLFFVLGIVISSLETIAIPFTKDMFGYDAGIFSSIFLRRFLLIPSILDWAYFSHFSDIGQFYWWATSRITLGMVQNPFGVPPPLLIGMSYFNESTMWANAGWIASGFANASYLGVLLYSVGFGIVLSAMDVLGKRLGTPFIVGAMTLTIWKVATTTDFLTALLTHGLLVGLLLLALVRDESHQSTPNVGAGDAGSPQGT